ncbi:MAG: ATP-dependent helicase, partial [Myxococcota bacterium]
MVQLTPEQQAIVNHTKGPALVFAVAGAGKTTAMVHRIERLVREQHFPAQSILATSFSRATVDDIKRSLSPWPHCKRVFTSTLHAIGYRILRRAQQKGLLAFTQSPDTNPEKLSEILIFRTLKSAREQGLVDKTELRNLDRDDFLNYISTCKGNLRYACLKSANLPLAAQALASQASAPENLPWYLTLYQEFERLRIQLQGYTFDDMLLQGWELLTRHPTLLEHFQSQFQCVMVDEFQDVNLVQSELLDLLIRPHNNYMVIGDDDQTIYEWRGARPHYILSFAERYNAQKYFIHDNFRCKAAQLVLANQIIVHNTQREPKTLQLTRGFDGHTFVHEYDDAADMGHQIVHEIQTALRRGFAKKDISILVRLYAQTPYIEHPLIEAQIPYRIVGSQPFYQRPEVRVLLNYLMLAQWNQRLAQQHPLHPNELPALSHAWKQIYNRPLRYISAELAEKILQDVCLHQITFNQALQRHAQDLRSWQRKGLKSLGEILLWLTSHFLPPSSEPKISAHSTKPQGDLFSEGA